MLLHGKNFNGDYWGRTASNLAAEGFRVIMPDVRLVELDGVGHLSLLQAYPRYIDALTSFLR